MAAGLAGRAAGLGCGCPADLHPARPWPPPAPATTEVPAEPGLIEIELSDGHRVGPQPGRTWRSCRARSPRCLADDPRPRPAPRLAGHRAHRHAQGLRRAGRPRPGPSGARSVLGPGLRVPRAAGPPDQGAVVGRPGPVPVRQAPGEGPLRLAVLVAGAAAALTPAQLAMLLEGIDWRAPLRTDRPTIAG